MPRWCAFDPNEIANVYANEAALVLVACQGCEREFLVAVSNSTLGWLQKGTRTSLLDLIEHGVVPTNGDPPNADCCAAGPTMSSEPVRVVEFWRRALPSPEWERGPRCEGSSADLERKASPRIDPGIH